jgi:methionyl-tRNA formyltransferase
MRLVFAGTPQTAVPSLEALLKSRHEVAAVITRPDAAAGRGLHERPSPVAARAQEAGVEVLKPRSPKEQGFLDRLAGLAPDCCPVTAYGALIPKAALDIPGHGWVNLHFSLLPAWRGAAPVPHAILHGDEITGATTFRLVAELDAGPVFGMMTEPIRPTDTAGDLLARLAGAGADLLVATLGQARLKVWPVRRRDGGQSGLRPGEVMVSRSEVFVGTATGPVELGDVQPGGKRRMSAAEWARGLRLVPGASGTFLG